MAKPFTQSATQQTSDSVSDDADSDDKWKAGQPTTREFPYPYDGSVN